MGRHQTLFRTCSVRFHPLARAENLFAKRPARRDMCSGTGHSMPTRAPGVRAVDKARFMTAQGRGPDVVRDPCMVTPPVFAVRRNRENAIHMIQPASPLSTPLDKARREGVARVRTRVPIVLDNFPATLPGDPHRMLRRLLPLRPGAWSNPLILCPSLAHAPDNLLGDFASALSSARAFFLWKQGGSDHCPPPSARTRRVLGPLDAPRPDMAQLAILTSTTMRMFFHAYDQPSLPSYIVPRDHVCAHTTNPYQPCHVCSRLPPVLEWGALWSKVAAMDPAHMWRPVWWDHARHGTDPSFAVVHTLMARLCVLQSAHLELQNLPATEVPTTLRRAIGMALSLHMPLVMAIEERGARAEWCTDAALGASVLLLAYPHWANPNMPPHGGSAPHATESLPYLFATAPSSDAWVANILPKARPRRLASRGIMPRLCRELWTYPEYDMQNFHLHVLAHLVFPSLTGDLPGATHVVGLPLRIKYARLLRPTPRKAQLYGRLLAWLNYHVVGLYTNQVVVFVNQQLLVSALVDGLAAQVDASPMVRYAMGQLFDWVAWCGLRRGSTDAAREWMDQPRHALTPFHSLLLSTHLALHAANHDSKTAKDVLSNHPRTDDSFALLSDYIQQRMSGRDHSSTRFKAVPTVITGVVRLYEALAKCPSLRNFRRAVTAMRASGFHIRQMLPFLVRSVSHDDVDADVLQAIARDPCMDPAEVLRHANRMSGIGVGMFKLLTAPHTHRLRVVHMNPEWGIHQRAAIRQRYNLMPGQLLPAVYTTWKACLACGKMGRIVVTFDTVFASLDALMPDTARAWRATYTTRSNPDGADANGLVFTANALGRDAPHIHGGRRRGRRCALLEYTSHSGVAVIAQRKAEWDKAVASWNASHNTEGGPRVPSTSTPASERPRKKQRTRAASTDTEDAPPQAVAGPVDMEDLIESIETEMGIKEADGAGWVPQKQPVKPTAAGRRKRRLDVLTNEGSNHVCVQLCEECGNLDDLRPQCKACNGQGVDVLCNRKYHGGATHSKRHCGLKMATLLALGTKVSLNGDTYFICPQPGCGLPAKFDPSSAAWGSDMCALCHFQHFYKRFTNQRLTASGLPVSVRTHGYMACIRCGTMAMPSHRARGRSSAPRRGYTYILSDAKTRRVGWRLICWRCWSAKADAFVARRPPGTLVDTSQLVAMLNRWNRTKFKRAMRKTHYLGVGMRGKAHIQAPPGVVDLDGHQVDHPWLLGIDQAARWSLDQRVSQLVFSQAEARALHQAKVRKEVQRALAACKRGPPL